MTDVFLQMVVSNLCVSLVLAIMAWGVQATCRRPLLANLLWVLVLVKLVTPPVVTLPIVPIPGSAAGPTMTTPDVVNAATTGERSFGLGSTSTQFARQPKAAATARTVVEQGKLGLLLLWMLGSLCVLAWSLARILRFNRLLNMASEVASSEIQAIAAKVARGLGLKSVPTIYATSARVSPMVWWLGRRVRIVIPAALPRELDAHQLRWVLAHELGHVRRRDHLVRWLEWLACVCFWWNPVAWWARRNLRINEEICCDALVLSSFNPRPHTYADALMTVIEYLASPVIRPPAMAIEMNSGGSLERRFEIMLSKTPIVGTSRGLRAGTLLMTLPLLLLGVAYAQERDGERSEEDCRALGASLRQAVANGELTGEQASERYNEVCGERGDHHDREGRDRRSEDECHAIGVRIREMVANGELTPEQGRERYDAACGERGEDSIEAHFRRLGIDDRAFEKIQAVLKENGFDDEQIEQSLGGLLRVVHEMKSEGEEFEPDPGLLGYFQNEVGLTDEQIELIQGIARRVVHASSMEGHYGRIGVGADMFAGIRTGLAESGLTEEQIEPALGAILRFIHEMKSEGEDYGLDPQLKGFFESRLRLTDEQIEHVEETAGSILQALSERGNDAKWDGIKRRIEGAVERGELTREQADAKYAEIKKELDREGEHE